MQPDKAAHLDRLDADDEWDRASRMARATMLETYGPNPFSYDDEDYLPYDYEPRVPNILFCAVAWAALVVVGAACVWMQW